MDKVTHLFTVIYTQFYNYEAKQENKQYKENPLISWAQMEEKPICQQVIE